jgi:uridylate kinase
MLTLSITSTEFGSRQQFGQSICVRKFGRSDVEGVYSHDPKHGSALRFSQLDWNEARPLAAKVVQLEAIDCAERFNLSIDVAALGSDDPRIIGAPSAGASCNG